MYLEVCLLGDSPSVLLIMKTKPHPQPSPALSPRVSLSWLSVTAPFCPAERSEWRTEDPQFLAEVLFAVTSMLSFTRLAFILPAHESLGTLQISIGKMIDDMIRCVLPLPVATPRPHCLLYSSALWGTGVLELCASPGLWAPAGSEPWGLEADSGNRNVRSSSAGRFTVPNPVTIANHHQQKQPLLVPLIPILGQLFFPLLEIEVKKAK